MHFIDCSFDATILDLKACSKKFPKIMIECEVCKQSELNYALNSVLRLPCSDVLRTILSCIKVASHGRKSVKE